MLLSYNSYIRDEICFIDDSLLTRFYSCITRISFSYSNFSLSSRIVSNRLNSSEIFYNSLSSSASSDLKICVLSVSDLSNLSTALKLLPNFSILSRHSCNSTPWISLESIFSLSTFFEISTSPPRILSLKSSLSLYNYPSSKLSIIVWLQLSTIWSISDSAPS